MRMQRWLFDQFRSVSELFGYEEWDAPVLESEELYTRKAGEEITGQLYNFEDKGGRRVALRPELTPSLARLVLQKGKALPFPAKWFCIGQCWRYERMTKGRRREHYQWNMDIFGVASVDAEAELLASIVAFLKRLGLSATDVGIKISSRKVLQAVLERYGVEEGQFAAVAVVVDKMEKLPRDEVEKQLAELGVVPAAVDGILSALSLNSLEDLESLLGTDSEAASDLKRLFELAKGYGYEDWLTFDASVVRGLAYYTGVVFEGFDRAGKLRAIFGGGRYDRLLGTFGGDNVPAAGFGFGDAVIIELLKDRKLLPNLGPKVDDLVVALDASLRPAAASVASRLRDAGRRVELVLEEKKLKWAFQRCERNGASRILLLGSDEWSRGAVNVKDLATGEQNEISVDELA
jgi:histidyl-tRNA synthetase